MGKKPFFENERLLIINDSVFETDLVKPESIDLVVTSPPYNVDIKYNSNNDQLSYDDYKKFSKKWMRRCYKWLKDDGRFCLNIPLDKNKGGQQSVGADLTKIAKDSVGFKYHSTIIWNEGNISRRTAWGSWGSASAPYVIAPVELIIVFYKKEWKKISGSKKSTIDKQDFIEWTNGLWTFNGESKKKIGHPAPFPIELPKRCIQLFSYEGDTVLDPFLGSGSTLVATYLNERKGVGIDIDTHYCDIAVKRLINEAGLEKIALKHHTKKSEKNPNNKKNTTQIDAIFQFFKDNPNQDVTYMRVRNWINNEYKVKNGSTINYFERKIRNLFEQGKLIYVKKGVHRYEP
ncbi:MAG: site-specific DNA-methyltransferase [Methanoregula sp.]